MRIHIYYSSLTGNTKKLAEYLYEHLQSPDWQLSLQQTKDVEEPLPGDVQLIAFWCRRSSMDDLSLKLLASMQGENVIAVGTLGGKAAEDYGRRVENTVRDVIMHKNTCLGTYACQGMIDPARTNKRRALSKEHPHYLDEENYARHLANQGRPHEADLQGALYYVRTILERKKKEI